MSSSNNRKSTTMSNPKDHEAPSSNNVPEVTSILSSSQPMSFYRHMSRKRRNTWLLPSNSPHPALPLQTAKRRGQYRPNVTNTALVLFLILLVGIRADKEQAPNEENDLSSWENEQPSMENSAVAGDLFSHTTPDLEPEEENVPQDLSTISRSGSDSYNIFSQVHRTSRQIANLRRRLTPGCVMEEVTDGEQCGYESVECGERTITDPVECGTQIVNDVLQCGEDLITDPSCGTEIIESAVKCGFDFVTDMAKCGAETVTDAVECGTDYLVEAVECGAETITDAVKCGSDHLVEAVECGTETITDAAKCGTDHLVEAVECGTETITDAAKCGTDHITSAAKCGQDTITSAARCGTQAVSDAAKCGTKAVTSVAECGSKTITSGATCGWNWLTGLFSGKKPKSCSVAATCNIAQTCDVAKSCKVDASCDWPKTCKINKDCDWPKTCEINKDCDWPKTCEINKSCDWPKTCDIAMSCEIPKSCTQELSCCSVAIDCKVPKYCQVAKTCEVEKCDEVVLDSSLKMCLDATEKMLDETHHAYPDISNVTIMTHVFHDAVYMIDDFASTTNVNEYETACSGNTGGLHELVYEANCVNDNAKKTAHVLAIEHPRCYDDSKCTRFQQELFEKFTVNLMTKRANLQEHSASDWECNGTLLDSTAPNKCRFETDMLNTKATAIVATNKRAGVGVVKQPLMYVLSKREKIVKIDYPVSSASASAQNTNTSEVELVNGLGYGNETLNYTVSLEEACSVGLFRTFETVYAVCDKSKSYFSGLYFKIHNFQACLGKLCEGATEEQVASVTGLLFRNMMRERGLLEDSVKKCVVSLDESPIPFWERTWLLITIGAVVSLAVLIVGGLLLFGDRENSTKGGGGAMKM